MNKRPVLQIEPSSLNFFTEDLFLPFIIENTGDAPLSVTSIKIEGHHAHAFALVPQPPTTVPPGGKHTVMVGVHPGGSAQAKAVVGSNVGEGVVTLIRHKTLHAPGAHPDAGTSGPGETPATGPASNAPAGSWGANGDDGGACFARGTWVLMADGEARPIESLVAGDLLLAVDERAHLEGAAPAPAPARVEVVLRHEDDHLLLDVGGIHATAVHRWGVLRDDAPGFSRTTSLVPGITRMRSLDGGVVGWAPAPTIAPVAKPAPVWNLETTAHTYLVAAQANGPYYVVHNAKKASSDGSDSGSSSGS